ncbi:MAG TPA: hypothetical protein VGA52_06125 [Anaerolineales bacterium]|jgi:hypothetical protein
MEPPSTVEESLRRFGLVPARIAYFRRWPPPPRWLVWMIEALWDIRPWETMADPEAFDYSPPFARTEELGFGTQAEYEADANDPKWFE